MGLLALVRAEVAESSVELGAQETRRPGHESEDHRERSSEAGERATRG